MIKEVEVLGFYLNSNKWILIIDQSSYLLSKYTKYLEL